MTVQGCSIAREKREKATSHEALLLVLPPSLLAGKPNSGGRQAASRRGGLSTHFPALSGHSGTELLGIGGSLESQNQFPWGIQQCWRRAAGKALCKLQPHRLPS